MGKLIVLDGLDGSGKSKTFTDGSWFVWYFCDLIKIRGSIGDVAIIGWIVVG